MWMVDQFCNKGGIRLLGLVTPNMNLRNVCADTDNADYVMCVEVYQNYYILRVTISHPDKSRREIHGSVNDSANSGNNFHLEEFLNILSGMGISEKKENIIITNTELPKMNSLTLAIHMSLKKKDDDKNCGAIPCLEMRSILDPIYDLTKCEEDDTRHIVMFEYKVMMSQNILNFINNQDEIRKFCINSFN